MKAKMKGFSLGGSRVNEEGLREGEKKVREKAIEIAKALKEKKISITIIAETSGLSIEEIKEL